MKCVYQILNTGSNLSSCRYIEWCLRVLPLNPICLILLDFLKHTLFLFLCTCVFIDIIRKCIIIFLVVDDTRAMNECDEDGDEDGPKACDDNEICETVPALGVTRCLCKKGFKHESTVSKRCVPGKTCFEGFFLGIKNS